MTAKPMQLPAVKPRYSQVRLSAPSTNSGAVYLSDTPVNSEATALRFAVAAGTKFPLKLSDLSLLYAYGTAGDYLDMLCEQKISKKEEKENESSNDE